MKLKYTIPVIFTAFSVSAIADSITFTGLVKTELPNVNIIASDTPVSDVKEFSLKPINSAGICSLQHNPVLAKTNTTRYNCLIEWESYEGLSQEALGIKGVVSGAGEKVFKYNLSLFDNGEFKPFYSGSRAVTFAEPVAPDAANILSRWSIRPDSVETEQRFLNRNETLTGVKFTTTARNYDQVVHFNNRNCVIQSTKTSCEIPTDKNYLTEVEPSGSEALPFYVTDKYSFFEPNSRDLLLSWDFRPPEIVSYFVNTQDSRLPMIINDFGDPFVLMPDQAAVVVRSPHAYEEGEWWYPTDPTLNMQISDGFDMTNTITFADKPVTFSLNLRNPANKYNALPIDKPIKMQDNLIYTYDFRNIQDGLYDFTISTKDVNNNGQVEVIEDVFVDRLPPDLQFVLNNKQHIGSTASIYSMSDITALAWGGWEDGTEIYEATVNNEPVEFVGGFPNIRRLGSIELPLNSVNTLVVKARDDIGNEVFKELKFRFAQYQFSHQSKETMKLIEPASIGLLQTQGLRCVYASSPELAAIYSATPRFRGCTINWNQVPPGLDVTLPTENTFRYHSIATGVMAETGSFPYSFEVVAHDHYGDSLKIYEGAGVLDILPVESPALIAGHAHILENFGEGYINSKPVNRPLVIPYQIKKSSNANVTVQVINDGGEVVFEREHDRQGTLAISMAISNIQDELPLVLNNYKVRAFYTNVPDIYTEQPYQSFNTPSTSVRLYTNHERTLLENSQFQVFANIAQITNGMKIYNAGMGDWDIYLATFDNGNYTPVTEKSSLNAEGAATFTLDTNQVANNVKLYTVAELKTPYPEVKAKLISNSLTSVNVLRLSSISAQLTTPEIRLPLPATFVVRAQMEEYTDTISTRQIFWETSDDGQSWVQASKGISNVYSILMKEPRSVYVRAALEHRLTREISYTNAILLTGFHEPLLELTGHNQVVAGALAEYSHTLSEYTIGKAAGEVEWTLDDQTTWVPMASHERVALDTEKVITARLLVKHEDETQPDYYIYDSVHVKVIPPVSLQPLVLASAYRREIGESVSFKATFRKQTYYPEDQIRYAFYTPLGETIASTELTQILSESHFIDGKAPYVFRSWVEGMMEQTITSTNISIAQSVYSFPVSSLQLYSQSRVINSPFVARIIANVQDAPSTVVFDAEWVLPPEVEVVKTHPGNRSISLVVKAPGLHNIKVIFSDNRGNTIEHSSLIDAIDPPPMKLELSGVASNKYMRPPLLYSVRAKAWPGHSSDYVNTYKWSINGEEKVNANSLLHHFELSEPGTYNLSLLAETKHGQTQTESISITVVANKEPTCAPFTEVRTTTLVVHANCSDEDGNVAQIHYSFEDKSGIDRTIQSYSQLMMFPLSQYPTLRVDIKAFDDSGAEVSTFINFAGI